MTNSEVEKLVTTKINEYFNNKRGTVPDDYAKDAWYSACTAGVFDGSDPRMFTSREQMAVVMYRLGLFKQLKCPENADFSTVVAGKFTTTLGTK